MNLAERLNSLTEHQDFPAGALYVIATPIGNLADITLRALACLARVDLVAAEDTRETRRLLAQYGLDVATQALHQHNERSQVESIVGQLAAGRRVALVSDAGTPAISDPGSRVVDAVMRAGLRVIPIPGASALTAALSTAGLAPGALHFAGFLPSKPKQARDALAQLAAHPAHLAFYEAPHRVRAAVALMTEVLGEERQLVIARELTKMHESIVRLPLREAPAFLAEDGQRERGEFVLIVEAPVAPEIDLGRTDPILKRLCEVVPLSEAVSLLAEMSGLPRGALYERALAMRDAAP